MMCLEGIFAEPAKTNRGGRCWRNNCFNGVSSLRTAFRIFEGNLPARRSRRSTIWSSDGDFTGGVVFQSLDLSACNSSAVENTLSNANVPPYRDSRLLIFQPKLKIFLFFSMSLNIKILSEAANQARGLCMDAVQASKSGHLGLPLGCAEMGAVLWGHALKYNPDEPRWINRDIFVLSAGHGSMFLYAWLHMSGYDLPMSEIKRFRQLHSKTPGHPEFGVTPGVECTTGPLGQGVGNSVGISVATKMAASRFNTDEHKILDQHVICLCGDGDMQEGVASEACALASHWGLDNLIFIYDSNAVTLDAAAKETQSEDTHKRMEAYGFDVQEIEGDDMQQFLDALNVAKRRDNGKPQFIIAHTLIGKGIPEVAGTYKAHGEAGAKYVDAARKALGLPEEHYFVSKDVYDYFAEHKKKLLADYEKWEQTYNAWRTKNPDKAKSLMTDWSEKSLPICSRKFLIFQRMRSWRREKPEAKYCSPLRKRCRCS
jgi:transketolase